MMQAKVGQRLIVRTWGRSQHEAIETKDVGGNARSDLGVAQDNEWTSEQKWCRTLNGSIEGSGVYGSHSGSLLLRVAFYGYVPLAARLTYFVLHCVAPIARTPTPTASRLVLRHLILQRVCLLLNQRPLAGSSA